MLGIFVVVFAVVLEMSSVWGLLGEPRGEDLLAACAAHAVAAGLLAWVVVALLRERLPSIRVSAVYPVCLLTPILNACVVLGAAIVLRLAPRKGGVPRQDEFARVPRSAAMTDWRQVASDVYDEAGLTSVLKWARDPERRCRAVLKSTRLSDREGIRLLRLALRDPEDEVRLLAFGLLEHKTQAAASRMREHEARLARAKTPAETGALHRAVAYEAWRMVNLGLAQGEVSGHYLALSESHLSEAIRQSPGSPGLYFLLGRVLLDLDNPQAARVAFEMARSHGLAPTRADLEVMGRASALDTPADEDRPLYPSAAPRDLSYTALRYAS